jgi:hypothetical protein
MRVKRRTRQKAAIPAEVSAAVRARVRAYEQAIATGDVAALLAAAEDHHGHEFVGLSPLERALTLEMAAIFPDADPAHVARAFVPVLAPIERLINQESPVEVALAVLIALRGIATPSTTH